jgi:hypothetical protein
MKLAAFSNFLVCAVLLTTIARADELSFNVSAPAPHGSDEAVLRVPAFDTRLGTLAHVELVLETVIDAHVRVENLGPLLTFAQIDLDSSATMRVPGQAAPFVFADVRRANCMLAASDGTPDFEGPSSMVLAARFVIESKLVVTSNLDKFQSSGTPRRVAVRASASSTETVTSDQPTISDTQFTVTHRLRVKYVFDRR